MKDRGKKLNKILDRYVGIPALFFLNILRQRNKIPLKVQNVGVIITPAIGDTILLQGLLRDLKEAGCRITIFAPRSTIGISKLIGFNDEVIEINYSSPFKSIKAIRSRKLDLMIDSAQWSRMSAIFCVTSDALYKIGFRTPGQLKHIGFDDYAIHSNETHEIYNLKKLNKLFPSVNKNLPCIELKQEVTKDEKLVVLHVPAGGYLAERKQLPVEYWAEIVNYILSRGFRICFSGTADNSSLVEEIISKSGVKEKIENKAGRMNLEETAYLLKSSAFVISVNTGIMHLASALGCNLIALHGPTNPLRWGPFNKNSVVIKSGYKEAPCLNLGFEYNCSDKTCECMKQISVNEIKKAIDSFIN